MVEKQRSPRVFVTYAWESDTHVAAVAQFCGLLRGRGIDVVLDQWAPPERRNWGEWTYDQIRAADFVVVIASPGYKLAAEGHAGAADHRGVQAEALLLRDLLQEDRRQWRAKILPVVLPGHVPTEIPVFLHPFSETHYIVPELNARGVDDLLQTVLADPGSRRLGGPTRRTTVPGVRYRSPAARRLIWLAVSASVVVSTAIGLMTNVAALRLPAGITEAVMVWAWPLLGLLVVAAILLAALRSRLLEPARLGAEPATAGPAQLPPTARAFVARDREIKIINRARDTGGPVVICGKPGIGKSALAIAAAHRLKHQYPDGQIYLDMSGLRAHPVTPEAALRRLLAAVGTDTTDTDVDTLSATFRSVTSSLRLIIVLDDAADASQVRPLLPGSRSCLVLVTSRRPLSDLDGATEVALDVFAEAEALTMLRGLVGPTRIDAEPAEALRLVHQCGRMALAVRIVGGRLASRPHWSLQHLADRLQSERRRLNELKLGDLEVRVCIALSYEDLSQTEALVFRRLGGLPGRDFDLDILVAATGIDPDLALCAYEALVDAQLVESSDPTRGKLHDLIRLFAQERLRIEEPEQEERAVTARILDAYTSRVLDAATALNLEGLVQHPAIEAAPHEPSTDLLTATDRLARAGAWLREEQENLVAAAETGLRGGHPKATELTYAILACLPNASGASLSALERLANDMASRAADADDAKGIALAEYYLGSLRRSQGDLPSAIRRLEHSAAQAAAHGDSLLRGWALRRLGQSYRETGRLRDSALTFATAAQALLDAGDIQGVTSMFLELAVLLKDAGRLDDAVRLMQAAIRRRETYGQDQPRDLRGLSWAHENLGAMLKRQRRFADSEAEHLTSLSMFRRLNDLVGQGYSVRNLGDLARIRQDPDAAIIWYRLALDLFNRTAERTGQSQALASLVLIEFEARHLRAAGTHAIRWALAPYPLRAKFAVVKRLRHRTKDMHDTAPVRADVSDDFWEAVTRTALNARAIDTTEDIG